MRMIEDLIVPPLRSLGDGIKVRRALPARQRRSIGPFVFFDQMGPIELKDGRALDVRPHPHIGLATVTYLFEGEIVHRDSLGFEQRIRPGEVNWMVAGRGIVHSERTPTEQRGTGSRVAGIQTWIALPEADEEIEPSFSHHDSLPSNSRAGVTLRVILGTFDELTSPVRLFSEMFYADAEMQAGACIAVPDGVSERAVYVADGAVTIDGQDVTTGQMAVITAGAAAVVHASAASRVMLIGGKPLDGPRYVWWNFVSSRKERIEQAARDWKAGRFAAVPGETEFIPLPDSAPGVVDYP
jgi:redox-sensitive bicupin YhaK (pirin superfamily)